MRPALFAALRSWRRPAWTAVIALGLYALLGFLIIPAVARSWIERTAGDWLGRPVELAKLRLNPFSLSTSAEGLAITDRDGAPLLRWDRLDINFQALSSLFRREWVFRDVRLIGAAARLAMAQDGSLNIEDVIDAIGAPAPDGEAAGPPPVVRVRRLRIEDSSLSFVDRSTGTTFTTTFGPLRIDLSDFTTRSDEDSVYSFRGSTESGETFSWRGRIGVDPLRSDGEFTLQNVALTKYSPYYRGTVPFDIRGGTADVASGYRFVWGPTERTLRLSGASATLRDLRLSEHQKEEVAVETPIAEIRGADLDLLSAVLSVDRVSTSGGRILLRQTADGRVNLLDMLMPFFQESGPDQAAPPSAATPSATPAAGASGSGATRPDAAPQAPSPTVAVSEIEFADYTVDVEDLAPPRPVKVRLDRIQLRIFGVDNVLGTPAKGVLDLRWNGAGTIRVDGDVSLVGLNGDFGIKLEGLDVVPVDPYVEPALDLRVRSGTFFADGRVKANLVDPENLQFAFAGSARMDDFVAADGPGGREFLRWRSLEMRDTDYSLHEDRLRVGALTILSPGLTVTQAANGAINLYSVLRMPQPTPEAGASEDTAPMPEAEAPPTEAAPVPAAGAQATAGAATGDMRIARARIRGGRIRVVDETMTPPVALALTRIDGTLTGLSSRPGARAGVSLSARINDAAPVRLDGQVDPLGADVFTDLMLQSQGIDLMPLGAYSARYLGYEFERGRLDLDMRYRLDQRTLTGSNVFKADPFLLGGKTESPDATKLPVRLGLALLRDRHGVIELDVPVQGSLDDPKFRLGRVILRALVNVFAKLVASPFTLLGRAFGGKEDVDLSVVDFTPGLAVLSDESKVRLEALSRGLTERPGLTLVIRGSADRAADPDALRQARLDGLVRQEKWRTLGRREREAVAAESLSIDPGEYPRFLKRACKTFRSSRPTEEEGPDLDSPAAVEAWMLERIEVSQDALDTLAEARARAVQDHIAAAGVATERLLVQHAPGEAARVNLELQ